MLAFTISKAQTVASDDFERANLGTDWTIYFGSGTIEIVDSSDLGFPSNNNAFGLVGWTATPFAADQYSEIIISANRPDSVLTQAFVRRRNSDGARYGFHWNAGFGGRWEIKYDGVPGPQTRLLAYLNGQGPVGGDVLTIRISGMTISGLVNGTMMLQVSDTAFTTSNPITTTGVPGIAFVYGSQSPVFPAAAIEQWNGGDLMQTVIPELESDFSSSVFPNPAFTEIKINLAAKNNFEIRIFNTLGEAVIKIKNQPVVNIFDLQRGIYFLETTVDGIRTMKKFVKQ